MKLEATVELWQEGLGIKGWKVRKVMGGCNNKKRVRVRVYPTQFYLQPDLT